MAGGPAGHTLPYRADVDGLRAVAILAVVVNHIGAPGFAGGYVGVDIFLVISGFLITRILIGDVAAGRHALASFYRRRILRILPALVVLLAVVTAVACVTMLPGELRRYAGSLGATALFASNILFFAEAGYFAPASAAKPLLHGWSLAVEEQFYILWPLLIAGAARLRPARPGPAIAAAIAGVTAISFAVALALVAIDKSAAFYLLPARFWELGLGGLLSLGIAAPRSRRLRETLAVAGLLLILGAVATFSWATPFPGAAALLPCGGAALLILTGGQGTVIARLLAHPLPVAIGRLSYSLYLWHWPVIVFAGSALFLMPTPAVKAAELAVSLLLGWASWRFVERPFRRPHGRWPTGAVLAGGAVAVAVPAMAAAALWAGGGLPGRFTPWERQMAAYEGISGDAAYRGGRCFVAAPHDRFDAAACLRRAGPGRPALLILGDSHAAHLWPGLAMQRDRFDVLQATMIECKPLLYPAGSATPCRRFFRSLLTDWLPRHPPDLLLLAARWRPEDLPLLRATLADPAVRAAHPVLIGPIPQYAGALPRLLVFAHRRHDPGLPGRLLDPAVFTTDAAMRAIAAAVGVPYISLVAALCTAPDRCETAAAPGVPLQFDYGHLTPPGSARVIRRILPRLAAIAAGQHP